MKKKLLFLASMLMMSVCTFAQTFTASWEMPTEAPEFTAWQMEKSFYLWNVGGQGFYMNHQGGSGGPWYGTHAFLYRNNGTRVRFTRTNPDANQNKNENWTREGVTDYTCLFTSHVQSTSRNMNAFYCSFGESATAVWTDNNGQNNRYWTIVPAEGNTFKISGSVLNQVDVTNAGDPAAGYSTASHFLSVTGDPDDLYNDESVVYFDDATDFAGFEVNDLWACVDSAVFADYMRWAIEAPALHDAIEEAMAAGVEEAWLANDLATYNDETSNAGKMQQAIKRVKAAQALCADIQAAMTKYGLSDADLAEYQSVLENPASTVEALEQAKEGVFELGRGLDVQAVIENMEIVQGKKNDISGVLDNPDFEAGNASGWDITYKGNSDEATNIGYQGANYKNEETGVTINKFIEAWKTNAAPNYLGDGSISQTIPGLPEGTYILAVDAIANREPGYRTSSNDPDGLPDDVELFALATKTGTEYKAAIASKWRAPVHVEFRFQHDGGTLQLGVRVVGSATAVTPVNWMAIDNLQLFYFGSGDVNPDKALLEDELATAQENYPLDELAELASTTSYKETYSQLVSDITAALAGDEADWSDLRTQLAAAVADLKAGVTAYNDFKKKWTIFGGSDAPGKWQEDYDNFPFLQTSTWGEFISYDQNPYTDEELSQLPTPWQLVDLNYDEAYMYTPDELTAYIATVDGLYRAAFAEALTPGADLTGLLTNASFADGTTGWTDNSSGRWGPLTLGGLKDYPCVEVFCDDNDLRGKVDIYQEIQADLPEGVYALTCQAFSRTQKESDPVVLFMNEYQTKVQDLTKDAVPEADAVNGENCLIDGTLFGYDGDNPVSYNEEPIYNTGGTTNTDVLRDEGYVPNGMTGASIAFRAGRYQQTAKGVVKDGKLKIGLKGVAGWTLWAKFTLVYLGDDPEALRDMLKEKIEDAEQFVAENYNAEEELQAITTPALNDFNSVIADAKAVDPEETDAEVLKDAVAAIDAAQKAAKENKEVLAEASAKAVELETAAAADDAEEAGKTAYVAIENQLTDDALKAMTTDQLKDIIEKMAEVNQKLKLGEFETSEDMTAWIENPSFETGNTAPWTTGGGGGDVGVKDNSNGTYTMVGADGAKVFNAWGGSGELYIQQTIAPLPAGKYSLKVLVASFATRVIKIAANDQVTEITVPDDKNNVAFEAEAIFELEETAPVTIKVSSITNGSGSDTNSFLKTDNFRLAYYGSEAGYNDFITGVEKIDYAPVAQKKNAKFFENGRIVIYKNGKKYNVAGQAIK